MKITQIGRHFETSMPFDYKMGYGGNELQWWSEDLWGRSIWW